MVEKMEVIANDSILYRSKVYSKGERFIIDSQVLLKQYLDRGLVSLFSEQRSQKKEAVAVVEGEPVKVETMSNVKQAEPEPQEAPKAEPKAKATKKVKAAKTTAKGGKK